MQRLAIRCRTTAHRGAVIEGWAHVQSRPEAKAVVTESFAHQLLSFREVATRWTSADKADATALAIAAAVIGYVVQSAFIDLEIDADVYCSGLEELGRSNVDTAEP